MVNVAGWIILGVGAFILLKGLNDINNYEGGAGIVELGIGGFIAAIGVVTLVVGGL